MKRYLTNSNYPEKPIDGSIKKALTLDSTELIKYVPPNTLIIAQTIKFSIHILTNLKKAEPPPRFSVIKNYCFQNVKPPPPQPKTS